MASYFIAFWNVENLFDVEDSPRREEKLKRTLKNELAGWDQRVLDRKISRLSACISAMNAGTGPDLLGVCEIESKYVLELLCRSLNTLHRDYRIVHADTGDNRGIDLAFIYDEKRFYVRPDEVFHHYIVKRVATRELVQVTFRRKSDDRPLVLIGNHWPSRLGGDEDSEAYRIVAGETLAYFHQRIYEVLGDQTAVLALGDFNDEPFNRSVEHFALAARDRDKVLRAKNRSFFNPMWRFYGSGRGTHYYDATPGILDQFLVSRTLFTGAGGYRIDEQSIDIFTLPEMKDARGHPVRHSRPSEKDFNPDGFSDHFPITMILQDA